MVSPLHGRPLARRAGSGWNASRLPELVKLGNERSCPANPATPIVPRLAAAGNNFLAVQHQIP
jgi:hypothetical protein